MNPVIEGLRGLGALMVLTHHYTYNLSSEWYSAANGLHFFHNGVDLFFVITGFLFAPFFLADKRMDSSAFLVRRFFRIYPLYILSLVLYTLTAVDSYPSFSLFIEHVFLLQTLPYHSLQETSAISLVYWTLAVEAQFYILAVIYPRIRDKLAIRRNTLVLSLASVIGFVVSALIWYSPSSDQWVLWQAQLPALMLEFMFGFYVYLGIQKLKQPGIALIAAVLFSGLGLLTALYISYPFWLSGALSARPFGVFNLLSGAAYALILFSFLSGFNRLNAGRSDDERYQQTRLKRYRLVMFVGAISYPVYLFHEMILRWSNAWLANGNQAIVISVITTLILSALIHRWIESPFREYGRRLSARHGDLTS